MKNPQPTSHQRAETKSFSTEIRNKTRISALPLQFNILLKGLGTVIRQEKEIKGIQSGKEELKLSLFAEDMIVYIENHIHSIKTLLELISEFGKPARLKVNTQKLKALLYINNKILGKKPHLLYIFLLQ